MMIFATVGTDLHPFDRLIDWLDQFQADNPDVVVVVQHGASKAPNVAKGIDYVDHTQLLDYLSSAAVVITHGGPATIMEAREHHGMPIAVPRDPALGEHVDGHQQAFCAMLGANKRVTLAVSREDFFAAMHAHLHGEAGSYGDADQLPAGIGRFAEEIDRLMTGPRRSWRDRLGGLLAVGQ